MKPFGPDGILNLDDMSEVPELLEVGADRPFDPQMVERLRSSLSDQLQRERGALARARAWRTPVRRVLLATMVVALVALGVFLGDGSIPMALGLAAGGISLCWISLRPLHEPAVREWRYHAIPVAAVLVIVGAACASDATGGTWTDHLRCFGPGLVLACMTLGAWAALSRHRIGFHALVAASGAGLTANAFLAGRCAHTSVVHLVLGHVSVLVLVVAATWLWDRLAAMKSP